jgi:hypothetical protein
MNDWHVRVWFDHNDLAQGEEQRKWRHPKPDLDLYGVGSTARKDITEALGPSFAAFVRKPVLTSCEATSPHVS